MKTPEEPAGQPRPDIAMFSVSRAELIRTYLCYAFIVLSSKALLALLHEYVISIVTEAEIFDLFILELHFPSAFTAYSFHCTIRLRLHFFWKKIRQ
jgi:hypothetical protein